MANLNSWSDVSSIAQRIEKNAYLIVREKGTMQGVVTTFRDASGMNVRRSYKYNSGTAVAIGDEDDLISHSFTPEADQDLTPAEIGLQFFITDARADSMLPEQIITDASVELGLAALDKVESDLYGDMASLTGGTVGASGSVATWSYVGAAISQARNANKSPSVPLNIVVHGYSYEALARAASLAATTSAVPIPYTEEMTRRGYVKTYMGADIYQSFQPPSSDDFTGGCFPKTAIAIDWRRPIRIEPERNASRRGWEFNMSAVYAHGIWRPDLGVVLLLVAATPAGT